MEKNIRLTVEIDGNFVTRDFHQSYTGQIDWGEKVEDMLDTLAKSNEKEF